MRRLAKLWILQIFETRMGFLFPSCKVDINYIFVILALIYERIKMLISSDHCNLFIAIFVSLSYDIIMSLIFIMF